MLFSKYRSIAENSIIPFERSITTIQQQETCGGAQTSDATGLRLDCQPQLIHAPTLLRAQICDALAFLECSVVSAPVNRLVPRLSIVKVRQYSPARYARRNDKIKHTAMWFSKIPIPGSPETIQRSEHYNCFTYHWTVTEFEFELTECYERGLARSVWTNPCKCQHHVQSY